MRASVSRQDRLRPRDDAPPNDTTLWDGLDCSFIHRYTYRLAEACLQRSRSSGNNMDTAASSPTRNASMPASAFDSVYAAAAGVAASRATARDMVDSSSPQSNYLAQMHTYPSDAPPGWWGSLWRWLLPSYFREQRRGAWLTQMRAMTTTELLKRMQLALAAGDREQSALIAEELSSRRATLPLGRWDEMGISPCAEPRASFPAKPPPMSGVRLSG